MLVCGTNAFSPSCDYMTVTDETISLDGNQMSVKGTIPFDPSDRFASLMNDDTLFSATSANFLGTEMVFQKHGPIPGQNAIKTEMKQSLLSEPNMISVNLVEASKDSDNGEDDQVFLFFTEKAVEEQPADLLVSRVARVCKSDLGGKKILQKKWSSFIKARLDCPFGDSSALVQDVFLLKSQTNWKDSIFYATFTSNPQHSGASSHSAVCAYRLSDVNDVFAGRFLAETRTGGWVPYTGAVPSPRPGSCINDETRAAGFSSSLDLPDDYTTFVINHPLMEGVVTPIGGKPLLVQSSRKFSKIVVDQVTSPKGEQHQMLLIGTESGWLQKAVKLDGEEGRIVEELQLFEDPLPVDFLQLSTTGQLYGGTSNAVVQVDVRDCSRYTSCDDCILARDPYCGWDRMEGKCASAAGTSSWFQSLTDGDTSLCPTPDVTKEPEVVVLIKDRAQFLPCHPDTNLPTSWRFADDILHPGPRLTPISQGLIITPSSSDAGLYTCETLQDIGGRMHRRTVIQYLVQVQDTCNLAPVQETSTPVVPVQDASTPVVLVQDASTPVVPVQDTSTPVLPVQDASTPVVPVQDASTPVVPVQDASTPVIPVQDASTPVVPVQDASTPVVPVQDASTPVVPVQDASTTVPVQDNRTLVRTLKGALITLVVFTGVVLIFTLLLLHHLKSRNQGNSEDSPV
ncbi:semaphorin-4E-like [Salarias fasciatus]|uniref:semaphorin-4E-like n=1 Tax=Salarias fasciatus TaxID=181472 RepID=UPI0011769482|nr:semaphorin-4E-like [Salarias fasciatus]